MEAANLLRRGTRSVKPRSIILKTTDQILGFSVFEKATEKQLEALRLAADGLTSKQIAKQLQVAPRTIDQRIDSVRGKLGGMPRNDLVRYFRAWQKVCGLTTYDPIPLTLPSGNAPNNSSQHDPELIFEDALSFDERAPWDRGRRWLRPEIEPSDLGAGSRLLIIIAGAVLILVGVVLTAAFSNALIELLGG